MTESRNRKLGSHVTHSQRLSVHNYLERRICDESCQFLVLDLGCGDGDDIMFLARKGHHVLATEDSEEALETARTRIHESGFTDQVTFRCLDPSRFHGLSFRRQFDLALTDFCFLNQFSPEQLRSFAAAAATWIRPGGHLVAILRPRFRLWDSTYRLLKTADSHRQPAARNWIHPPAFLSRIFTPAFATRRVVALGIVLPPLASHNFGQRHPRLLRALSHVERRLQPLPGLSAISDHYLIHFERTTARLVEAEQSLRNIAVGTQTAPAGIGSSGLNLN